MEISAPGNHIHCFGVGDGWPNKERNHSSFLYRFESGSILMDCGEPLCRTYLNSGYSFDEFDAIILSHFHGDHFGGFLMFLQGLWLRERKKDLTVYMPEDGIEVVEKLIQVACLFKELMPFKLDFKPIENNKPFKVGDNLITPTRTSHLDSLKEQFHDKYPLNFDCFAFGIESSGGYVLHSADIGHPSDLSSLMDKPIDFFVCELAHFNPVELFEAIKGIQIKKLLLIHLPGFLWENQHEVIELARKIVPDLDFEIAEQNRIYPISPATITQPNLEKKIAQS